MNFKNTHKLSVIMPCFNEAESIPSLMPRMLQSLEDLKSTKRIQDFELIVVNDQSTDRSYEELCQFPKVKVLNLMSGQRGYGKALKAGFSQASGDWICFLDIDNSYRPEELSILIAEAQKGHSDFIMGARSFHERGMSITRGFGNWLYMFLAKLFYGSHLDDVCSGYRLFHKKYKDEILQIPEDGLDFSIFLTLQLLLEKVHIQQVPIQYDQRLGASKLSLFKDGFSFLRVILIIKLRRAYAFKHSRV